jgi:hypothetical protein
MTSFLPESDNALTAAAYGLFFGIPCFNPADTSFDVASGFDAMALWTTEVADPPAPLPVAPSDGVALGKRSGRDWKYLGQIDRLNSPERC